MADPVGADIEKVGNPMAACPFSQNVTLQRRFRVLDRGTWSMTTFMRVGSNMRSLPRFSKSTIAGGVVISWQKTASSRIT